jgi:PAS domain S-box-containing protein
VLAGGAATWSEDQLLPFSRNGRIEDIYWTFSYSAVRNDQGAIGGVLTVCQETTDKVVSLQQLEKSDAELHFAIEATELGVWDHNPITGLFKGNNRLKDWFGLPADAEISLTSAINAINSEDRDRVATAIEAALYPESGGSYDIEYTITNAKTGQQRTVRAKGLAHFEQDGKPYRFAGTLQDITAQAASRQKLEQGEERFRVLAETLPNLVWVTDGEGTSEYTSKQWSDYSGLEANTQDIWEKMLHPDELESFNAVWMESVATGKPYLSEGRLRNRQGTYLWHKIEGVPVKDNSGKVVRWVGSCTNIHDQKTFSEKLEAVVAERTAALERSNEDLQQFAHVASHDLKEPVRKIKTFAGQLEVEAAGTLSKIGSLYLQKVQQAADRMFLMINGVLEYSTLSAMDTAPESVDLQSIVDSIVQDLEVLIAQKGARVEAQNLPLLSGTPVLLYQLFYNLIYNALKFSAANRTPVVQVVAETISAGENGSRRARITVADNGIGFEPEYAENIFKTFTRLHSKDKYEGTGLGLSLCKKIVERHGGVIWADGKVDVGARFTMELPVAE